MPVRPFIAAPLALLGALLPARAQEGAPAAELPLVQGIVVEGERRYTEAQIAGVLGQKVGSPFDPAALDQGIRRLGSAFQVRALVARRDVPGGVELLVSVEELPVDREPRFVGNEAIKESKLRTWALLEEKSELYLHQAGRVRQRILENYRREGFYFAEVSVLTREGEGVVPDVIFEIREGRKVRVSDVVIEGNRSLPDTSLLGLFEDGLTSLSSAKLEGPSLLNWLGEVFDEEILQADLLAMRNVYRDLGWYDAVVELDRLEFNEDRSRVTVHVRIDEGERYSVSSVSIEAFEWADPGAGLNDELVPAQLLYPQEELLALCSLSPGKYFERTLKEKDQSALRERYGKDGRISHPTLPRGISWSFEQPELVFDVENHTVAVTYRLVQGREVTIREILINGNTHTRDRVVRREISIFPGQRADLKEIERSLGLITATNFFSDSYNRMQHRDPTYRFVATPDNPGQVDLEYVLEEGRVIDVNVAGGVGSDNGAFAQVALTMRNFDASDAPDSWFGSFGEVWRKEALHGSGQLLELYATPGTVVSEYRVRFMEPDLFGWHLRPIMLDVDFSKRLRLYRTHDEQRSQLRLRLGRRLNFETRAWAGFVLQDVEVSDLDPDGVPLELYDQYDRGLTRLAGVSFDLSSRRVDNQLIPHDGYTLALGSVLYSRQLGSEFDITTAELRGDWYTPTWTTDDGTQPVLHLEFNIAAQQPYDETPRVPYSERYFLGGTNSLRGFQFRGVGPVDPLSREPRGGETQLFGTFEWFYPLHATTQPGTYRKLEVLRGGLFFDYGLLDPESWSLDFDELRTSAGFTLGLTYPIPITLNFGYPIRQFDGDNRQTFSFTMGTR